MAAVSAQHLPSERLSKGEGEASHEPSRRKVLVVGATGHIGRATVRALSRSGFSVVACTRDPNSQQAKAISLPGVNLATISTPDCVKSAADGCEFAVIIPPGFESRSRWTTDVVENLANLGLSRIVLVSVPGANPDAKFHFGREFGAMEKALRDKGIYSCIVRLPMFMENLYGAISQIKADGMLRWRPKANAKYTPVAAADVGEAIAAIVANFGVHDGQEYILAAPAVSGHDIARIISEATDMSVEVAQVDDAAFLQSMRELGVPEWQADGVLELMKLVDAGHLELPGKDLASLLQRTPTTVEDFVNGDFKRALLA